MISKLIAVDFDGTIVHHRFPSIGEPLPHAFRVLKRLQDAGHRLVLLTCRENEKNRGYLDEAIDYCREHGINFVSANENRREDDFRDHNMVLGGCRKVYADYYIDDRIIGGFPGWLEIERFFFGNHGDPNG